MRKNTDQNNSKYRHFSRSDSVYILLSFWQSYLTAFQLKQKWIWTVMQIEKKNNLVIQKADTGSTIVILDKDSYSKSIEALLKDSSKFKNILVALDKDLKCVINS